MNRYPNRLSVTVYNSNHVKLTKAERERSRSLTCEKPQSYTNLFIEKLPYTFNKQDVFDLFSKYGTVLDVKMKKPASNVPLQSINSMPCSAYVNFKEQTQAKAALLAMNGQSIIPGGQTLRIDYY
jgi:RNA recognition motif-containing protein